MKRYIKRITFMVFIALSTTMVLANTLNFEDLVTHVRAALPADMQQHAQHVAGIMAMEGMTQVSQATPEQLQEMAEVVAQIKKQTELMQQGPSGMAPLLPFAQQTPTQRSNMATYAYVLYRKFTQIYKHDSNGLGISLTLIDHAIRAAALVQGLKYQAEKNAPFMQEVMTKFSTDAATPRDEQEIGRRLGQVLQTSLRVYFDPDFFDQHVSLPLQLLVKAAPAGLYHMLMSNKEYDASQAVPLAQLISDGWQAKKDLEGCDDMQVMGHTTSDALNCSAFYKSAFSTTANIGAVKASRALGKAVKKKVGRDKVKTVERTTLGIIKPKMVSDLAKRIAIPLMFESIKAAAQGTWFERFVPDFNKAELGMVGSARDVVVKSGDDSKIVTLFTQISRMGFVQKQLATYALSAMGEHVSVRLLQGLVNNRRAITDTTIKGAQKVGSIFTRLGLPNPVSSVLAKGTNVRRQFFVKRPELMIDVVGAATLMSKMSQRFFDKNDRRFLEKQATRDLRFVFSRIGKLKRLKGFMTSVREKDVRRSIGIRLHRLFDKIEEHGILGKIFDQGISFGLLDKYSFGKFVLQRLGAMSALTLGASLIPGK